MPSALSRFWKQLHHHLIAGGWLKYLLGWFGRLLIIAIFLLAVWMLLVQLYKLGSPEPLEDEPQDEQTQQQVEKPSALDLPDEDDDDGEDSDTADSAESRAAATPTSSGGKVEGSASQKLAMPQKPSVSQPSTGSGKQAADQSNTVLAHYQRAFKRIWKALRQTRWPDMLAAALLTAANFFVLVCYDWLAVRWIGSKLPVRKIALAAFGGYTLSYNFGATIFGTSIRYRLYSAWGMSLLQIAELLVILGLTFWFGLFFVAGLFFMIAPMEVPQKMIEGLHHWGIPVPADTFWIGVALFATTVVYVGLAAIFRGSIKIWRWTIPVPPLKLTLYQVAIASADLLLAGSIFYFCMPATGVSYFYAVEVFMLAYTANVLTHVPGGYGVIEAVILQFMPDNFKAEVFAGILMFRVIWFWAPLLISAVCLGINEVYLRNQNNGNGSPAAEVNDVEPLPLPAAKEAVTADETDQRG